MPTSYEQWATLATSLKEQLQQIQRYTIALSEAVERQDTDSLDALLLQRGQHMSEVDVLTPRLAAMEEEMEHVPELRASRTERTDLLREIISLDEEIRKMLKRELSDLREDIVDLKEQRRGAKAYNESLQRSKGLLINKKK